MHNQLQILLSNNLKRNKIMETLEEAAKNYNLNTINAFGDYESFIAGAKWQQQLSYSEEEVNTLIILLKSTTEYEVLQSFRDKVQQFKNK